ncbi:Fe-S cluster protein [Candidatus Peregrinibacteria bacterium CG10_big_fil_rev_8_21_14_0_10_49_10]|nr:MAG: Fe-S cluster protein [Candidatus Peregrinibacteria bacterium CG10_big_fil_rev_8_21_14_0_10_49_10]
MDLYAENILDHYRDPRHKETMVDASVTHTEANHVCGDEVCLQLHIDNDRIASIAWQGTGCAISQAGMSILTEEVEGMTVEEVEKLQKQDIYDLLGVPIGPRRFKCALICLHTLKNAIHIYCGEEKQGWLDTVEIDGE